MEVINISKNIWVDTIEEYFKDKEAVWYEMPDNVVGVLVIQGHTNGTSTELSYISFKNGSAFEWNNHLDVYAGDFYGMYAIEKKQGSEKKCAK